MPGKRLILISIILFVSMKVMGQTPGYATPAALQSGYQPAFSLLTDAGFEDEDSGLFMPIFLNTVVGFGIGSFKQNDLSGGFAGLLGHFAALGVAGTGMILALGPGLVGLIVDDTSYAELGISLILTGAGLAFASKVYGIIRPIQFEKEE